MLENVWNEAGVDLAKWLPQYATQRYGVHNETIDSAWRILERTVYNGGLGEGGPESIIVARPTINMFGDRVRTKLDYDPQELVSAWTLFIQTIPDLQQSDGFQYDLVDITRQVLANYATPLQQKWVLAYLQNDTGSFTKYTQEFLQLMDDMDELLATRKDFLLGKWITDARSCGADENEKKLYELNARNVITLWGNKESELHEYSNRQWAGLIKGFYKPRWQRFFTYMQQKMATGARMETNDFEAAVKIWEWNWVNGNETYSASPTGNAIEVAKRLHTKYVNRVKREL
jgi:alpha-N-acetylglucosaminidase